MAKGLLICTEHACDSGHIIAEAQLNSEATLNSLDLQMVRELTQTLRRWATQDDVVLVVLTGAGDKAFCAGGDIQALYRAMVANHEQERIVDDYPYRFFEEEYRLDHYIHTYPKPVITLGHGIVMGGGLGLLSASAYRVLTERSRIASPEISIGLFPDAGASWLLKNIPQHYAIFLALTGSQINATDALQLGIATHCIAHGSRASLINQLCRLPWHTAPTQGLLDDLLDEQLTVDDSLMPAARISDVPERAIDFDDVAAQVAALTELPSENEWVQRGIKNLDQGCPTSAGIVVEQLKRVQTMTIADTFRMELTIATHCANNRDFSEGVRALLIDKDNNPNWQYNDLATLPRQHVLSHFAPPWTQHPLGDLGEHL
jgi:enoyl-CoA hydratase/carnithine racemase